MLRSSRMLGSQLARNISWLKRILYRSFIGMSFFAIICCGKKVEDSDKSSGSQRYDAPISTDLEQALRDQQLSCEPGSVCPNYLTLINVVDKDKIRSCTGFLVGRDIVATSSSCLPPFLRLSQQDCSKDIHLYFGSSTLEDKTIRVKCSSVISATSIKTTNPVRWRDDVAFLKLESSLPYRRTLGFSRKGFEEAQSYTSWYVSRMDGKTSFIKRSSCQTVQNSYVNPFANHISSPNILVSDCDLPPESSGAPLIDRRGEVRGMISLAASSSISDYLLKVGLITAPLKKMFHGTSFACAQTVHDSQVLDEAECFKNMSQVALDEEISKMLSPENVFNRALAPIQEELAKVTPYMNFQASLTGDSNLKKLSFSPSCFKTLKEWINSVENTSTLVTNFSFPQIEVRKSLDSYGKLAVQIIRQKSESYSLQFSTKNLRRYGNSKVYFWNEHFNFNYPKITENCQ